MGKKIALLLKKNRHSDRHTEEGQIVVFNIEEGQVIGVENQIIRSRDINDLSLWALKKKIKEIYTPEVDEQIRSFFGKMGIHVRKYDELGDNKLFNTFIF